MKKFLLFCLAGIVCLASNLNSQVIYQDDFESYNVNQGIAAQSDKWSTWGGTASDDPKVSSEKAKSGSKSVNIIADKDAIIKLGNLTTGRYCTEFEISIKDNHIGYFNLLQKFASTAEATKWGVEVFFVDGTIALVQEGKVNEVEGLTYTPGTWMNVKVFVDLDSDYASIYFNNKFYGGHKWSLGAANKGDEVKALDAINFYGNSEKLASGQTVTANYFIDDIKIQKLENLAPARNLNCVIENSYDIKLSWEAPESGTPTSYLIYKNGKFLTEVAAATLTYTAANQFPGSYNFEIRANYQGLGCSPAINKEISIEGGADREFVLFEVFTSTGCSACPYGARAIDKLAEDNNLKTAIIEYHYNYPPVNDPYYKPEFNTRAQDYSVQGFPTAYINGSTEVGFSSNIEYTVNVLKSHYSNMIATPTVYSINLQSTKLEDKKFKLNVEVNESTKLSNDEVRLFVVLTETNIAHNWGGAPPNKMSHVNFVARDVYPNTNGDKLNFTGQTSDSKSYEIQVPDSYNIENCDFILFAQNMKSKEILQAKKIKVSSIIPMDISETNLLEINLYPNPASDLLNIESNSNIEKVEIMSIDGKIIKSLKINDSKATCNTQDLAKGFYLIRIHQDKDIIIKHFAIQ